MKWYHERRQASQVACPKDSVSNSKSATRQSTHDMAFSLVHKVLNPVFPPVPEDLLQVPPRPLPQHTSLIRRFTLPLLIDDFPHVRDSLTNEVLPRRSPHTFADDIPPYRPGSHLVPDVSWVIDQLEDSVGGIVPLAVAVFVDTSVASWSVGITFGEFSKDFWDERRLEDEPVGFPVCWQVALLAKSYHL